MPFAGLKHTVLIQPDGIVVAFGLNDYSQVSAGQFHSVFEAMEMLWFADVMNLDNAIFRRIRKCYTHKFLRVPYCATVLLRSDGSVVVCGWN